MVMHPSTGLEGPLKVPNNASQRKHRAITFSLKHLKRKGSNGYRQSRSNSVMIMSNYNLYMRESV